MQRYLEAREQRAKINDKLYQLWAVISVYLRGQFWRVGIVLSTNYMKRFWVIQLITDNSNLDQKLKPENELRQ